MLIYIISIYLFIAVLMTAFFSTYVLSKSKSSYIRLFSALNLCIGVYLLGYLLEINSSGLEQMMFWNMIQYLGIPFFPVLWLMVSLYYTKKINTLPVWQVILLLSVPLLTFIFRITNTYHNLYYTSELIHETGKYLFLYLEKGPWYYVHGAYSFISLMLATYIFNRAFVKSSLTDRIKFGILTIASLFPYIGFILIIVDFGGIALDYTALIMPVSIGFIMYAIFRYDFLELKTMAREIAFENSQDAIIITDSNYKVMDYNKAAEKFMKEINISFSSDNMPILTGRLRKTDYYEFSVKDKYYSVNTTVIGHKNTGIIKTIQDITEKVRVNYKLKKLATIDELSDLYNRRQFMEFAEKEFTVAKRYKRGFSVLMIDIDDFKMINDIFGHDAGDEIIRSVGNIIKKLFRSADISGRLGGEEFSILLINTSIEDAYEVAERFRVTIEKTIIKYNETELKTTVSIGISAYSSNAQNFKHILKYADMAMYESKSKGKNLTSIRSL